MDVEEIIEEFHLLMDRSKSTAQYAHLRSSINSDSEAIKFVELFAKKTKSNWTPQKQYSLKYVFYSTWFCNPFWRKKVLPEGDDDGPFFRKRDASQEDECSAKINIYIRKSDASSKAYDEYLYYDLPRPCVIEITGLHNHGVECPEEKAIKGVVDKLRSLFPDDSVKREFFKYFQSGLSVSDAKRKYTMHCRHNQQPKRSLNTVPTLRQAEILYKEWQEVNELEKLQNVKDGLNSKLKEDSWRTSHQKHISFKEFLKAIPKREVMYSVKHLESQTDIHVESNENAQNEDIKFPLVFVSVGSVAGMPSNEAHLVYKLKHDIGGELVSDLVRPRIYSIYIESENSYETTSNEILGIPKSTDESHEFVEATPKYLLGMPIKLEPLNDGYEDTPVEGPNKINDTSILQTPTEATLSCGDTATADIDIKPDIYCGNETMTEEIDIKPNICNTGSFIPLMFTLKGSVFETSNRKSLVYDLIQGSTGKQATESVTPLISSVQINSLTEASFEFKDGTVLTADVPLSITVQTEFLEVNSNTASSSDVNVRVDDEDIPVIINASSGSGDLFPVITDKHLLIQKDQVKLSGIHHISAPGNVNRPVQNKRLKRETEQVIVKSTFNRGFFSLY